MSAAAHPDPVRSLTQLPETSYYRTIVDTARLMGWRVHHQRSTAIGTPIMGDAGFPDFVLVHPRGHVLFVEIKTDRTASKLTMEQQRWGEALVAAGGRWYCMRMPSQLDELLTMLVDLARPDT